MEIKTGIIGPDGIRKNILYELLSQQGILFEDESDLEDTLKYLRETQGRTLKDEAVKVKVITIDE